MLKNIVFDMGNVLLTFDPLQACLRHAGTPEDARLLAEAIFFTPEWGEKIDGGACTDLEYIPCAQSRLHTPRLRDLAARVLMDWYLDGLYPVSGMEAAVESLLQRGYRLFVLSNVGYGFHDFSYKMPYLPRFGGAMLSCEEKLRKPDPAIFLRLCDKYALKPGECLFVDDLIANVRGAESAGLHGHCFADGNISRMLAAVEAF